MTSKDISLLFIILPLCLFSFCLDFVIVHNYFPLAKSNLRKNCFKLLRHFLTFVCFHWKVTWHLDKVNKVKTERVNNLIDAQFLCLGVTGFNVTLGYSPKRPINSCCRICIILCVVFKKCLFIEALYRPLFTKYAHCKPLFPLQNNA